MNDVADVDLPDASHAIDGRGELRVAQLRLRPLDRRLVRLDRRLQLRDLRGLRLDQLRSGPALVPQRGVTLEIGLRVRELGLVAAAVRVRLIELRMIRARINHGEQVAGLYGLPFGEIDFRDLSLDLAADDHGVIGDHRADTLQINWHIAAGDGARNHGDGWHHRRGRRCRLDMPLRHADTGNDRGDGKRRNCGNDHLASHWSLPTRRLRISSHPKTFAARYCPSPDTEPG